MPGGIYPVKGRSPLGALRHSERKRAREGGDRCADRSEGIGNPA
ncbi:MAG TPA: hypothetical protein VGB26_02455 [Nitrospiria bacterium]